MCLLFANAFFLRQKNVVFLLLLVDKYSYIRMNYTLDLFLNVMIFLVFYGILSSVNNMHLTHFCHMQGLYGLYTREWREKVYFPGVTNNQLTIYYRGIQCLFACTSGVNCIICLSVCLSIIYLSSIISGWSRYKYLFVSLSHKVCRHSWVCLLSKCSTSGAESLWVLFKIKFLHICVCLLLEVRLFTDN